MRQSKHDQHKINHKPKILNHKSGFTLVELLVVITIIGILIALLLPAVQAAREAARQVQCRNHLKQIALAWHLHSQAHKKYPTGGWGYTWAPHPARGCDLSQPGGWGYSILPYIEQQALYDLGSNISRDDQNSAVLLNSNVQRLQTPLEFWNCPTRRRALIYPVGTAYGFTQQPTLCGPLTLGSARTDYAANGGWNWAGWGGGPGSLAAGDTWTNQQWFPNQWQNPKYARGVLYLHHQYSEQDITDGLSATYMVGEKYLNPNEYLTGTSVGDDQGPYMSEERDNVRSIAYAPLQDTPGYDDTTSFGSAHSNGFFMGFCDGSVQLMSYSISQDIHKLLAARDDGQTIDAKSY